MVSVALGWTEKDIAEEADIDSVLATISVDALDATGSLASCSPADEEDTATMGEVSTALVVVDCSVELALSLAADVD